MSHDTGMVTIPLSTYEHYKRVEQELATTKASLEEEKQKTWSMFGHFFDPQRKLGVADDFNNFSKRLYIKALQPVTTVDVTPYDIQSDWEVTAIIRHLMDKHIVDVVSAVHMGKLNLMRELRM